MILLRLDMQLEHITQPTIRPLPFATRRPLLVLFAAITVLLKRLRLSTIPHPRTNRVRLGKHPHRAQRRVLPCVVVQAMLEQLECRLGDARGAAGVMVCAGREAANGGRGDGRCVGERFCAVKRIKEGLVWGEVVWVLEGVHGRNQEWIKYIALIRVRGVGEEGG